MTTEQTLQDKLRADAASGECVEWVNMTFIAAADRIDELERQLAEAQKDQERLDWMISNRITFSTNISDEYPGDYCMWQFSAINGDPFILRRTDDPRETIDAAMKVKI
jgi:thymidylate kinase